MKNVRFVSLAKDDKDVILTVSDNRGHRAYYRFGQAQQIMVLQEFMKVEPVEECPAI